MHKLHKLPTARAGDSLWIERNDAALYWSEIEVIGKSKIKVPYYIVEDFCCMPESEQLESLEHTQSHETFSLDKLDTIQRLRRDCHNACYWYDEVLERGIPTAPSVLLPIDELGMWHSSVEENLSRFPFVRHCSCSPKDVTERCVFRTLPDALRALTRSARTAGELTGHHIFMREERDFEWEARCFWSRGRLTGVSCVNLEIKPLVLEWFERYSSAIPYHQAVVDIGLARQTDCVELVEFNSFGPDMPATAGNFSWAEDMMQLVFGTTTEFRTTEH